MAVAKYLEATASSSVPTYWDQKCNSRKPKSSTLLFHGLSNHMDRDSKDDVMGN